MAQPKTTKPGTGTQERRRITDILQGRFGEKWLVDEDYTILNISIENTVFDGKPSKVAVFTTTGLKADGTPKTVFSGSSVVVGQASDLLFSAERGEPVFPFDATLRERQSNKSRFKYQELE